MQGNGVAIVNLGLSSAIPEKNCVRVTVGIVGCVELLDDEELVAAVPPDTLVT